LEKRQGKGIIYWASENSPPSSITSKELADESFLVQERIVELVNSSSGSCLVHQIPILFEKKYNQKLDYKRLGYKKLQKLLKNIPTVQIVESETILSVEIVKEKNSLEINETERKEKNIESYSLSRNILENIDTESQRSELTNARELFKDDDALPESFYEPFVKARSTTASVSQDFTSIKTGDRGAENDQFSLRSSLMHEKEKLTHRNLYIGNEEAAETFKEMALIGHTSKDAKEIYLNTHIPFCVAAIGVQGAGKSHTLGCFLESCLLSNKSLENENTIRLNKPMTVLVLHYDQSTTSICEATGLLSPNLNSNISIAKSNSVVMVSPTFYRQRKKFYGGYCTVRPLLFRWNTLTADHIKRIMRINTDDNQLYVASFMTLLRKYQRQAVVPQFAEFISEIKEICNIKGQSGPLYQRIALLESMVAESEVNQDIVSESMDLSKAVSSEMKLIIVDLTDPLLTKDEANGLFQVVTEQFRSTPVEGGKLLALDEAHKFMDGIKSDGLSEAIVNIARLMRHDGIRLAVSTQSPMALAPELLELVSVAVLHHFHSKNWWDYLCQKLPLHDVDFTKVLDLAPGNALLFASRHNFTSSIINIWLRNRLTADFGTSRTN